ncbi:hypothetical protein SAMN05216480_10430 [Pustulibacterium marinum]|uniref:Uncharacterized protein n=1 Tax=Pustulibacterium marinum TaxID=1224947 RepID=A0A1I7GAG0_9FLAO|nr:hypothetical protein [Pustulibacterium marinum]SFU45423.1 hypothetical protein SAMN05216480_10430 [Pustulibacterium marinum]
MPKEGTHADLVFSQMDLKVVLQHIPLSNDSIALGTIAFPVFNFIGENQYETLTDLEKKYCYKVYCYGSFLGYTDTSQLKQGFVPITCIDPITDFKYDPATLTVTVAWEVLKNCK